MKLFQSELMMATQALILSALHSRQCWKISGVGCLRSGKFITIWKGIYSDSGSISRDYSQLFG